MSLHTARRLIFAAAPACLLAACATVSEAPVKDAVLTLQLQQTVALGESVRLRYDRVADSRCPADATCIWAGKIVYHFTLTGRSGSEPFALEPGGPDFTSTAKGVRVALGAVQPPPVSAAGAPQPPHPVTVSVSGL